MFLLLGRWSGLNFIIMRIENLRAGRVFGAVSKMIIYAPARLKWKAMNVNMRYELHAILVVDWRLHEYIVLLL